MILLAHIAVLLISGGLVLFLHTMGPTFGWGVVFGIAIYSLYWRHKYGFWPN
jgi:hypothetical protein